MKCEEKYANLVYIALFRSRTSAIHISHAIVMRVVRARHSEVERYYPEWVNDFIFISSQQTYALSCCFPIGTNKMKRSLLAACKAIGVCLLKL